jgi:hypothetical protein
VPWEDGAAVDNEVVIATTKDVSSGGISLVLPSPFHVEELLVGFWPFDPQAAEAEDAPAYFLGHVQQRAEIGGGYWQLGIRVARRLDDPRLAERLLPYARRLLPHAFRSRAVAAVSAV